MATIRVSPSPPASNNDQSVWGVWFKQVADVINRLGQVVVNGSYTPTIQNALNVSSSTSATALYTKLDNIVHVFGEVSITPTVAGTTTNFYLSLPINVKDYAVGAGMARGTCNSPKFTSGYITDLTTALVLVSFVSADTLAHNITYHFSYSLI